MYFDWYPYESFGLDVLSWVWMLLTLRFLSAILDRWGDLVAIGFYWCMLFLLCVWQKLFFDTESFGSFFGMLRVLAWGMFFFGPWACAIVYRWHTDVGSKRIFMGLGVVLTLIGVDYFWV